MNNERARFAQIVAERRRLLGLTLDELQAAGGPSDVTTSKIEKGALAAPSARTLKRLDHSLRWAEGSAARAFAGGDPTPLEELPATRRSTPAAVSADVDSVTLSLNVVNDLSDIAKRYELLATGVDPQIAAPLKEINSDFDLLVDRILRAWLIAQLERRNVGPDSPLTHDPMVEMLIGDYLNRTPEPPTPDDAHDLLYLRWLTGRPIDADASTEATFIARRSSAQEKCK
ncbi:helix-turn-helix domain-containing protein [Rhodococcus chondri]|uniref:Helix-turn-helix transcriptional regulator n=1 Tax=Rhodococcus chondri TaxID=3065941 RepID=A0ABU7JTN2_9NOCA|nr:helix-turn-helix transcriptional regulator [Rhodococcus sp. CC-R104]MEE2033383.1 helix-turn-helix transcriptional regulator [Rhodococcus sp. CC-R104]